MTGVKRPLGYTIVEVMIVLAVSGVTFLIAVVFVGGKQEATAFTQGAINAASQIQDVANEVAAGQYSDQAFTCTPTISNGQQSIAFTVPGNNPKYHGVGTDQNCTFVGKVVHLQNGQLLSGYEIFSLAGSTLAVNGQPAQSLNDADPTPIDNSNIISGPDANDGVDLTLNSQTSDSLNFISAIAYANDNTTVLSRTAYGIAFTQSFGSLAAEGTSYQSGAQSVQLEYVNIPAGATQAQAAAAITGGDNYKAAGSIVVCLSSGTDTAADRNAKVTIGSNGNPQNVVAQILEAGVTC
jgi:prepilin-type N-terminal cleavage/methylation domain-containing protein